MIKRRGAAQGVAAQGARKPAKKKKKRRAERRGAWGGKGPERRWERGRR